MDTQSSHWLQTAAASGTKRTDSAGGTGREKEGLGRDYMELVEADFTGGVAQAFEFVEAEIRRQGVARSRVKALLREPIPDQKELDAALAEAEALPPLWQRISGLSLRDLELVPPSSLQAGIRRLLHVVEALYRAEMKTEDVDDDGPPSKLLDGSVSYAGRSPLWDPLDQICLVLGIAKTKLSALCAMRTGLKIRDVCDAIRCEGLRGFLREKFRGLMNGWRESFSAKDSALMPEDFEGAGWRFLKWMRGGGRGETRKGLALAMGLPSRERLDRAAFVVEDMTLEQLELEVAMEAIRELFGDVLKGVSANKGLALEKGDGSARSAGCDDVGAEGNPFCDPGFGLGLEGEVPPEKE